MRHPRKQDWLQELQLCCSAHLLGAGGGIHASELDESEALASLGNVSQASRIAAPQAKERDNHAHGAIVKPKSVADAVDVNPAVTLNKN